MAWGRKLIRENVIVRILPEETQERTTRLSLRLDNELLRDHTNEFLDIKLSLLILSIGCYNGDETGSTSKALRSNLNPGVLSGFSFASISFIFLTTA